MATSPRTAKDQLDEDDLDDSIIEDEDATDVDLIKPWDPKRIRIQFRTDGDSPWVTPTNMGFGISYALPVVLAAMTAAEGGMLIVENPDSCSSRGVVG